MCAKGCASIDLQAAIIAAKPGDTIVLRAGEVYKGNFNLPWKEGSEYITIQSSKVDQLPPAGYRVSPAHAPLMATLQQAHRAIPVLVAGANEFEVRSVDIASGRLIFEWTLFQNGEAVACRGRELPAPLVAGNVYYARDVTRNTLRLASSPTASPIQLTTSPRVGGMRCSQGLTAHHYRLRGIEFVTVEGAPSEYTLVSIGSGAEINRSSAPHHIELTQVYIHGRSSRTAANEGPRFCLVLNAAHTTIRDSYISECKKEGEESKGIGAWQAPGPLLIKNNYIEAASLNILLGGAPTAIPGHVVGDGDGTGKGGGVVIEGNHFSKQLYWKYQAGPGQPKAPFGPCQEGSYQLDTSKGRLYWCEHDGTGLAWTPHPACSDGEYFRRNDVAQNCAAGACWVCRGGSFEQVTGPYRGGSYVVKGVIETKSLMNGLIAGNVLENSWSTPVLIPMQVFNEGYNWNRVENTEFRDNIIRNSSSGYHNGTEGSGRFTHPNRNVRIVNNLFYDIGITRTPTLRVVTARPAMFQGPCLNCSFEHNTLLTGLPASAGIMFSGEPLAGFRFADNILHANLYGIFGDGHGQDCEAIEYYAGRSAFRHNIFINNTGALPNRSAGSCAVKTRYVSPKTLLFDEAYRLKRDSPYSASCARKCDFAATDGKDLGADIDETEAATSGAVAGTPSWQEQMQLRVSPAALQAVVSYRSFEDGACKLQLFTNAARTRLHPDTLTAETQSDHRPQNRISGRQRQFQLGAVAPLGPQTDYWYLIECQRRRIPGRFRTTGAAP
ncbi:MAG: hypothetical protein HY235_07065 [Acidobacteria bacterium]|nr:hypothetical protein [Acidobacteriota bacterium]